MDPLSSLALLNRCVPDEVHHQLLQSYKEIVKANPNIHTLYSSEPYRKPIININDLVKKEDIEKCLRSAVSSESNVVTIDSLPHGGVDVEFGLQLTLNHKGVNHLNKVTTMKERFNVRKSER